jgi:hypothetical protein
MTLAVTVPNHINHHMRVGLGYLEYHAHHRPQPTPIITP